MNGVREHVPTVHLKAGEMHCADRPTLVVTVLGSCLSVILYNRRLGIGGICHGLLPSCGKQKTCSGDCAEKFRYVDCAIRQMLKTFDRFGVKRSEIEVKCFGGADMFSRPIEKPGLLSVGQQNSETAEEVMKSEGLTLTTRDVGGLQGRKILFYTHTGEVLLKRLANRQHHPALTEASTA
jgi:chemotaxis protein CheD